MGIKKKEPNTRNQKENTDMFESNENKENTQKDNRGNQEMKSIQTKTRDQRGNDEGNKAFVRIPDEP